MTVRTTRTTNIAKRNEQLRKDFEELINTPIKVNRKEIMPTTDQIIAYLAKTHHLSARTVRDVLKSPPPAPICEPSPNLREKRLRASASSPAKINPHTSPQK